MTTEDIISELAAAEAANPAPVKRKKSAGKTNGHTVLNQDELLTITVRRIVAALGLEQAPYNVTADALVSKVKEFERPYSGPIQ